MVEHAGEESRVGGGLANLLRADAGQREEAAEPLGIGGEEAKAPESPAFRRLSRVMRAFSPSLFAFP